MLANGLCPRCYASMPLTATDCSRCGRSGNAVVPVEEVEWSESWLIAAIVVLLVGLVVAAWLY